MKKTLYYISFDMLETAMSRRVEISKTEYEKQLAFLTQQITETVENECPVEQLPTSTYETSSTYETKNFFMCGCATTVLHKSECKEGFCFKAKKDR
jgi:hypothetical protein